MGDEKEKGSEIRIHKSRVKIVKLKIHLYIVSVYSIKLDCQIQTLMILFTHSVKS